MAEVTKTLGEWEKERGFILQDGNVNKKYTEAEVDELLLTPKSVGVDHEGRTEFLKSNGYDVTRANMVDPTLSAKGTDDEPNA
jgi:predicted nucleotidyltransferase